MQSVVALIAAEHSALRSRLVALVRTCRSALRDEKLRPYLVRELAELIAAIREHLAYEEQALFPLLRREGAWGPERVEALMQEHEEQREILVALLEDVSDGTRPLAKTVDEIVWFVRSFERDMEREESGVVAQSEIAVADQVDG